MQRWSGASVGPTVIVTAAMTPDPEVSGSPGEDIEDPDPPGGGRRATAVSAALVGVVALVPRLLTVGHFANPDETLWMLRTDTFSRALIHGNLRDMDALHPIAGTVPGITTVWLGTVGRAVWELGGAVGLVDPGTPFVTSSSAYTAAQSVVAVVTSVLIGLFVWVVAKWWSRRVAIIAGSVFATEPFWVSLGSMLHTDELVALFGLNGLVVLAWSLGLPEDRRPPRAGLWAGVAGALLACSALTKMTGVAFGLPAVGMLLWAGFRDVRRRGPTPITTAMVPLLRRSMWLIVAALATVVVLYPALVVDPVAQWHAFGAQVDVATGDRGDFFLGRFRRHPGPWYYPVTVGYHSTVWFLVLLPIGLVSGLVRAATRRYTLLGLAWAVVPAVALLSSGLTYERYALVVLGPLTFAAASAAGAIRFRSDRTRTWSDGAVALCAFGALVFAIATAPWGLVTFDPVVARVRAPDRVVRVGWGEDLAAAMPIVEADVARLGKSCSEVTLKRDLRVPLFRTSCNPGRAGPGNDPDYVIVGQWRIQRTPSTVEWLDGPYVHVGTARRSGVPLAQVWRRRGFS